MKKKPEDIFRSCGGQLRMSEAIERGITRYMLYSLRDKGVIKQVSRGVLSSGGASAHQQPKPCDA